MALALLVAGCGTAVPHGQSDWERRNLPAAAPADETVTPPAYPANANLLEFPVIGADGFRFFIDGSTLAPGKDGVVRYVLVARSPEGVDNVTYEGLRCESADQRIYALGRDGSWTAARGGWRPVSAPRHRVLYNEYFCPQSVAIRSAYEGVLALQQGGHPFSKGFGAEAGKGR
jgi:CNP1-like family protein